MSDTADMATLVVAAVGAATGITSLGWQIANRRRGAHRIKLIVHRDMQLSYTDGETNGGFLTFNVSNTGAAAVTITGFGIELGDGGGLVSTDFPCGTQRPPYRLEAGDAVTFFMEQAPVDRVMTSGRGRARANITLGTGKTIYAPMPKVT